MTTSTTSEARIPPVHDSFKVEIKKETIIEEAITEEKYRSKKDTVSLSDYQVESEYTTKSEYSTKSKYQNIVSTDLDVINNISLQPQFILMNSMTTTTR